MTTSKGQYKIVYEVMLILIGILITGYVVTNFSNLQVSVTALTVEDNLNSVANHVIMGTIKVSSGQSSVVRLKIPEKISDFVYRIELYQDSRLVVKTVSNSPISVTRHIFNIGEGNNVNRILPSQVISSARVIEVFAEKDEFGDTRISIRRGSDVS